MYYFIIAYFCLACISLVAIFSFFLGRFIWHIFYYLKNKRNNSIENNLEVKK